MLGPHTGKRRTTFETAIIDSDTEKKGGILKMKRHSLVHLLVVLSVSLFMSATLHAQTPEDFWAMRVGNTWNYLGSDPPATWTIQDSFAVIDTTTFPLPTYRETTTTQGQGQPDYAWYTISPTQKVVWKTQTWDDFDGSYSTMVFHTGIVLARNPIFVGDTWSSSSTGTLTDPTGTISITATLSGLVLPYGSVTVPQGTHNAFGIRTIINIPELAPFVAIPQIERFVPYLGVVKVEYIDPDFPWTEALTSTNVSPKSWGTFVDVPSGHYAGTFIQQLAGAGITGGCVAGPPPYYCPENSITRGQMAVFIEASLGHPANNCTGRFSDVPVGNPFCGFIERMADDGITGGCGSGIFCPNSPVTRGQMSVFIEAALGHTSSTCTGRFADVPTGNPFCRFIEHLAADGITGGCGGGNYCPDSPVTRAQMAVFLVAAPAPLNP
jgi:hypothetical protein